MSTKGEPTPGEWTADREYIVANGVRIGIVYWDPDGYYGTAISVEERDANARLFAASKKLLASLEAMLDLSRRRGEPCPDPEGEQIRADARAAIAKAKDQ